MSASLRALPGGRIGSDGRPPPHDLDAERAVLGCAMVDPAALAKVSDLLAPEQFYSGVHQAIFGACLGVVADGKTCDLPQVGARLQPAQLEAVGGPGYLIEVCDAEFVRSNVRAYAEIVHERWRQRETVYVARKVMAMGSEHMQPDAVQGFIDDATAALGALARKSSKVRSMSSKQMLDGVARQILSASEAKAKGAAPRTVPTGIAPLDRLTGGLALGSKSTIVAPTGVGKSVSSVHIATHAASTGVGVLVFTCGEMSWEQISARQIANVAGIDEALIRRALRGEGFQQGHWDRIMAEGERIARLPMVVDDTPGLTVEEIVGRARRAADTMPAEMKVPLGLVVVDYVQKVTPSAHIRNGERQPAVTHVTLQLERIAAELKVAVLELSQARMNEDPTSRPVAGRAAKWSSTIDDTAAVLLGLYRPNPSRREHVRGVLLKNRGGLEEEFDLRFNYPHSRIEEP